MKVNKKIVSILMSVYNEEDYVTSAIESIASQEINGFCIEVICIDDFSEDSTWNIISSLSKKYKFLHCFKNELKGKNHAFNLAYKRSVGDVLCLFAGDDILPLSAIKERVTPLLEKRDKSISTCKYITFSNKKYLDGIVVPKTDVALVNGGTIAITRPFADLVFPLPVTLANEDTWIKCHVDFMDDIEVVNIPTIGLNYRLHEKNSVRRDCTFEEKSTALKKRIFVYSVFLEKYREELPQARIDSLARLVALNTLQCEKNIISIIFMKKISARDKFRAVIYSSKILHATHMYLHRYTTRR